MISLPNVDGGLIPGERFALRKLGGSASKGDDLPLPDMMPDMEALEKDTLL